MPTCLRIGRPGDGGHAGPFHHLANALFLHDLLPATRTPVTIADTAEIESLTTITDTPPDQLLLDRATDSERSAWSPRHRAARSHLPARPRPGA